MEQAVGDEAASGVQATFASRVRDAMPEEATVWKAEHGMIALGLPGLGAAASVRVARQIVTEVTEEVVPTPAGPVGLSVAVGAASTNGGDGGRLGTAARGALEEAVRRRVAVVHRDGEAQRHARLESEERSLERTAMRAASGAGLFTTFRPVYRADLSGTPAYHFCLPQFDDGMGTVRAGRDIASAATRLGLTPFIDRTVVSTVLDGLVRSPKARVACKVHGASLSDVRLAVEVAARSSEKPDVAERLILQVDAKDWPVPGGAAGAALERTRSLGCAIAIANIRLTSLPVSAMTRRCADLLALSPALTSAAPSDPEAQVEIRMIQDFAMRFGLTTVAKEVRSDAEVNAMRGLGVDCLEGPAVVAPRAKAG